MTSICLGLVTRGLRYLTNMYRQIILVIQFNARVKPSKIRIIFLDIVSIVSKRLITTAELACDSMARTRQNYTKEESKIIEYGTQFEWEKQRIIKTTIHHISTEMAPGRGRTFDASIQHELVKRQALTQVADNREQSARHDEHAPLEHVSQPVGQSIQVELETSY